eukprot:scaffold2465_cov261-Prasinococcus_capsulatus_cf.AAC.1
MNEEGGTRGGWVGAAPAPPPPPKGAPAAAAGVGGTEGSRRSRRSRCGGSLLRASRGVSPPRARGAPSGPPRALSARPAASASSPPSSNHPFPRHLWRGCFAAAAARRGIVAHGFERCRAGRWGELAWRPPSPQAGCLRHPPSRAPVPHVPRRVPSADGGAAAHARRPGIRGRPTRRGSVRATSQQRETLATCGRTRGSGLAQQATGNGSQGCAGQATQRAGFPSATATVEPATPLNDSGHSPARCETGLKKDAFTDAHAAGGAPPRRPGRPGRSAACGR